VFVIIAGAGRAAATLALTLNRAAHEVLLVEHRPDVLEHIHRELPTELIYEGIASDPRTLQLAGASRADALVASMPEDAESLAICFIARQRFGVKRTIATINNPRNAWLFTSLFHVDVALNQADILASLIEQQMSLGDMMTLLKLRQGTFSLVSEKLPPSAPAIGQAIKALPLPRNAVICAILRAGDVIIPRGDVVFAAHDEVLALVDAAAAAELAHLLGGVPARA
jgi:trk system potassium uptake protein TrkA